MNRFPTNKWINDEWIYVINYKIKIHKVRHNYVYKSIIFYKLFMFLIEFH